MHILRKLPFEAGRGRFLDFLGDLGVVCGVGDTLAVRVSWCCGHFDYLKEDFELVWDRCGISLELKYLCEIIGWVTEGEHSSIYITLGAGVASGISDVLRDVVLCNLSRAI